MIRFEHGDVRLTVLDAGTVWLDGGAMFGVVPKPLWERKRPPDERNRIRLAMNVLLIEDGARRILVDTGAGTKADAKTTEIFGLQAKSAAQTLEPASLAPEDIDTVVCTHLHFDHAGGNTRRAGDGSLEPAYPRAEYVIQHGELQLARMDNERIRAAFLPEDYEPLVEQDRVRLVEGDTELTGDVALRLAPGHTTHMQIVTVGGPGTVAFLADLVPTSSHLPFGWGMGFDLEPLVTLASKKRFLPRAADEGWVVVFEHDRELPLARLALRDGRIVAEPFEAEA